MFKTNKKKTTSGFSLSELLMVLVIAGVIVALVAPRIKKTNSAALKSTHRQERTHINTLLEAYYFENSHYPTKMTNDAWNSRGGADYTYYFPDGIPVTCNQNVKYKIVDGRISLSEHKDHE